MTKYRKEKDTMGTVNVPFEKYWGAQTERSRKNFPIGPSASMPIEVIQAFAIIKKSAAIANEKLGKLTHNKSKLIYQVCDEILSGALDDHFPLVIWQTGSGTQTNMNVNEVIVNRAHVIEGNTLGDGKTSLHPNDDVNLSQSSNDTFPTAMNIAGYTVVVDNLIPALKNFAAVCEKKSQEFKDIVKTGRTHMMDATPVTLGQEFSGYAMQVRKGIKSLEQSLSDLSELALGATAVGTGINAPETYDTLAIGYIAEFTKKPFVVTDNKFSAIAAHDDLVRTHGVIKSLAVSILKIINDIRLLASGPRTGIGELLIPANEPGSSIMPGKVNPTQVEALAMVCTQIIGNDTVLTIGGAGGQLELNVFKPLIIANFLQSSKLLASGIDSFTKRCLLGIKADNQRISGHLNQSLMLVTALVPHIGYEKAAEVAKASHNNRTSLQEEAIRMGYASREDCEKWLDPEPMVTGVKPKQQ